MQTPYDVKKSVDTPTKDQKNHARKFEHNAFECHPKKHGIVLKIRIKIFPFAQLNNSN